MNKQERDFVQTVWKFYEEKGRHTLPWRKTKNPYKILVSEIMLQQTQVDRVLPKYQAFIKRFPNIDDLARASLGEVLTLWQGLGYNRRAKMLHLCAQIVCSEYKSTFPQTYEALLALPGVGPYTAKAVMAFAYGISSTLIETNIRSVYLHHFCKEQEGVTDAQLLLYIERTRSVDNPKEWYYALMDYGSYLKKEYGNPNTKSKHYTKQSTFKGSIRQLRGAIIRELSHDSKTRIALLALLRQFDELDVDLQIEQLIAEGMIVKKGRKYELPA